MVIGVGIGMELSMSEQGIVFLFSCVVGVFLGAFYDVFRIIRIAFNSKWLTVFFQDFVFCVFSALSVILLVFYTNSGIVRWFSLLGCFMSFLLYHLTVGRLIMLMAKKIIDFIRMTLNFILSITIVPAKKFVIFIAKLIKKLALLIFARLKKTRKYIYYKNKKRAAARSASRGFNLYTAEKAPGVIAKTVGAEIKSEIKKQAEAEKARKKESAANREKTRGYKKSGGRTQSLGSLKSLSSIKFK